MPETVRKSEQEPQTGSPAAAPPEPSLGVPQRRRRVLPLLLTLIAVAVAAVLGWTSWNAYMMAPWTRDGTVRAYVVTMAPEIAGRIVELPVVDNQYVHKGDLLMVIDPTDYKIALDRADASVRLAQANAENAQREAKRRLELSSLAVTQEQQQTYAAGATVAEAQYRQAQADLGQARVNLERTELRSPVNGWITNLTSRIGDYAQAGQNRLSVVDADSFWIDAYFEETKVHAIHDGDLATVKLMGAKAPIRGHVGGLAKAINVANAQSDPEGLATVNPIFTWVRLAQRIPVRIAIDEVPQGVALAAGMTATVQIESRTGR